MNLEQLSQLSPMMSLAVGAVLLLFGRKLFWLFVAVMVFLFGMQFGSQVITGVEPWVVLAVSVLIGVIGAVLAIVLQKVAVVLAGGAAGGLWAMRLTTDAGWAAPMPLVAFVVVGLLAAILAALLFEWALIILSSLTGASLIIQPLALAAGAQLIVWVVLLAIGIVVQARLRTRTTTES